MLRSVFKAHSCCSKLLPLPGAKTPLLRPRTPQLVGVKRGPVAKLKQTDGGSSRLSSPPGRVTLGKSLPL